MMIRTLLGLLVLITLSCGGPAADAGAEETAGDEATTMQAAAEELPMSGENYTISEVDSEPASPRMEMTGNLAGTEVVVNYGSPSVKGRTIWGDLEPYDAVWRAGANEATTITFQDDVVVEGEPLSAGTYSFFVIPRAGSDWTVIFNEQAEQWGAYNYDDAQDALRVNVSPQLGNANQEELHYYIDGNDLVLRWADAALPVSLSSPAE